MPEISLCKWCHEKIAPLYCENECATCQEARVWMEKNRQLAAKMLSHLLVKHNSGRGSIFRKEEGK